MQMTVLSAVSTTAFQFPCIAARKHMTVRLELFEVRCGHLTDEASVREIDSQVQTYSNCI